MTAPQAVPPGGQRSGARLLDPGIPGALLRYRILAYTVGVGLVILVFVGIPIQIAGDKTVVAIVGPLHGFLYIIYLVFALDLARRARFSFLQLLAMVGAGLIPFVAFVIERKVTARIEAGAEPWRLPERFRRR